MQILLDTVEPFTSDSRGRNATKSGSLKVAKKTFTSYSHWLSIHRYLQWYSATSILVENNAHNINTAIKLCVEKSVNSDRVIHCRVVCCNKAQKPAQRMQKGFTRIFINTVKWLLNKYETMARCYCYCDCILQCRIITSFTSPYKCNFLAYEVSGILYCYALFVWVYVWGSVPRTRDWT